VVERNGCRSYAAHCSAHGRRHDHGAVAIHVRHSGRVLVAAQAECAGWTQPTASASRSG